MAAEAGVWCRLGGGQQGSGWWAALSFILTQAPPGLGQRTWLHLPCLSGVPNWPLPVGRPTVTKSFVPLLSPADDVPPYFKTEPVRTQVHLEGNRLVLTCMAEGSWPLEFKWLHNNRELTKFSLEYRQVTPLPVLAAGATALPDGVLVCVCVVCGGGGR